MTVKVSVIIVNYNGKRFLHDCLTSLRDSGKTSKEIIFVDNASKDGSVDFVMNNFPEVKIIRNEKNIGFAGGNNVGFKEAQGEYLLLLNNDTRVEKNFLDIFLQAFGEIPNLGCVQPKIVLMKDNNIIDSCGSFFTDSSFLYHFGYDKNQKLGIYNKPFPVFSVKGVAMLLRKDLVDRIGLFDDDFWSYYEETDFCHRVWLAGYECWYYPKTKIFHEAGGTTLAYFQSSYIQFQNFKNKLASIIKNFETVTLTRFIPTYLVINFFLSLFFLITLKPKLFVSLLRALWWNLIHFKSTVSKRKNIQQLRRTTDKEIFQKVKRNPRFSYYYFQQFGKLKDYSDDPYESR